MRCEMGFHAQGVRFTIKELLKIRMRFEQNLAWFQLGLIVQDDKTQTKFQRS